MLEWCLPAPGEFDPYDSIGVLAHASIRRDGALVVRIRRYFSVPQKTSIAAG